MDKALARVGTWPTQQQDEATEPLALDEMWPDAIEVDDETLAEIDECLTEIAKSSLVDLAEVEAMFARFRK